MGADSKSRRERWETITKKSKDCPVCPPHKGENARKKAKPDRYKTKRKGK